MLAPISYVFFQCVSQRRLYERGQPYITKAYFGLEDPPVNLSRIAIGDGTIGSGVEFEELPTVYPLDC